MKTLFVTIREFLANGGNIEIGRTIYREEARHFDSEYLKNHGMLLSSLSQGEFIGKNEEQGTYLVKNESFKSMPLSETTGYIKIEATPIYK